VKQQHVAWGGKERLICDWNEIGSENRERVRVAEVADETLRDGLQSPSVRDPAIDEKLALLHHMVQLGIDCAAIGQPSSHRRQFCDTLRLAQEIADERLPIDVYATARTLREDIEPIVEISQRAGIAITVATFIGSSPIRMYTEGWELDRLQQLTEDAVTFAVRQGLPVMFVTEDTTRTRPEVLRRLNSTAIRCGAGRLCISDTVGHALPRGAAALVRFTRDIVREVTGAEEIAIDWHGHRDRGFDVANAFAAWEAGARRCHGTALGVGERCGNAAIEQLLVNLRLNGWAQGDLSTLPEYVALASHALGIPIPASQPIVGADAFRTATGVHAAALMKGRAKGDDWAVDRIYSSVPASIVGRKQEVEIGPLSGAANVRYYLDARGLAYDDETISFLLDRAKRTNRTLHESDVRSLLRERVVRGLRRISVERRESLSLAQDVVNR
jgi:2-isopropylmalate synthase